MQAIRKEKLSYREAAKLYGVPLTTVYKAAKNPYHVPKSPGPPTVLTAQEESEVVNWILYRAEIGFPVSKMELLDSVQAYVTALKKDTPFTEGRPGRHWFEHFKKRHPELTIRTAQHLSLTRASVTEEDLRQWFAEVRAHLDKKNLLNIEASRVFNCDETSIQLCPKSDKVFTKKGARSAYKIVDADEKECLTTLFMYSADGTRASPMIMYKYILNQMNESGEILVYTYLYRISGADIENVEFYHLIYIYE